MICPPSGNFATTAGVGDCDGVFFDDVNFCEGQINSFAQTEKPTQKPTSKPTSNPPSLNPTPRPSPALTSVYTKKPTVRPTPQPMGRPTPSPTSEPTFYPTRELTVASTDSPTTPPTSEPITMILNYTGNGKTGYDLCEGDCDRDSDVSPPPIVFGSYPNSF